MSIEREYRTRNFATIVYKDSAPENWQQILSDQLVQAFISPYHDQDLNPTGEPKKAHWHVIVMFDSVKTKRQAEALFSKINGVGCEIVNSLRGYCRYLCHLDNPDKHQYPVDQVISFCGADYLDIISLESDNLKTLDEILRFIEVHNISNFYLLCKYAFAYEESWKRLLTTYHIIKILLFYQELQQQRYHYP